LKRFSLLNLFFVVTIATLSIAIFTGWRKRVALEEKMELREAELKEENRLIGRQMLRLKAELGNLRVDDRGVAHRERVGSVTGGIYARKHLRFRVFLPALPGGGKYAHCIGVGDLPATGFPGWKMDWPTNKSGDSQIEVSVAEVEGDREYIFDLAIGGKSAFLSDIWGEQLATLPINVGSADFYYENLDETFGWDSFARGTSSTGSARVYQPGLPIGLLHWRARERNSGTMNSTAKGTDHIMSWIVPWDKETHGRTETQHKFVQPLSAAQ